MKKRKKRFTPTIDPILYLIKPPHGNFDITKKSILARWAYSHRGKNGLIDQKIEIFKVHDIDTVIQQREKTHQTHLSSALKTFYDHMRHL